jgi:hypothetical protein
MDLPGSLKDPSTWQRSGHSDRNGSEISESEVIHPALDEDHTGAPSAASTEIPSQERKKHYPPRTCRICLESVSPTFHPPSTNLPTFLQSSAHVVYESPEAELGRLLRPCKCKGSSRYVHEGCLNTWRHADPSYGRRNYWECPTCKFRYRLERMTWSRWISSTATQIILTIGILLFTIFLLGFIADPIINLYFDPLDVILDEEYWEPDHILNTPPSDARSSWTEHFLKGLASLGVLSFFRGVFAFSPYVRGSVSLGSRGRSTGRTRLSSTTWLVVLVGICSFLWVGGKLPIHANDYANTNTLQAVYKGVRAWARRTLEKASERVLDVSVNGPDEDEDLGTHQEVNIKED